MRGFGGGAPWSPLQLPGLLLWEEAWNTSNPTDGGGRFTSLLDKSGAGKHLLAQTLGPTAYADPMLGGKKVAQYGGSAGEYCKIASITRPVTQIVVVASTGAFTANYPITSYGSNYPYLSFSNAAIGRVGYWPEATTQLYTTAAPLVEQNFKTLFSVDDGTNVSIITLDSDFATEVETVSVVDALGRAASPGVLAQGALAAGTFPMAQKIAAQIAMSGVISASDRARVAAYLRSQLYAQAQPRMPWVGTRTTQSRAQPGPYPIRHEGQSGDTIATWGNRLVGTWGDWDPAHYAVGGTGDPGAGNRGAAETLAGQGNLNLLLIVNIGGNDAAGTISIPNTQLVLRRFASIVGNVGGAVKIVMCTEPPFGTIYPTQNANLATYNAGLVGMVSTMQGLGYSIVLADCAAGFDAATMLQADSIHCKATGNDHMSAAIVGAVTGAGWNVSSVQTCVSGHSRIEGGDSTMPGATGGVRPALARDLAEA